MKAKWLSLVWVSCLLLIVACSAFGQVPRTISYQGRLTNDVGAPLDGTYSIAFKLYDVASGGTALWTETKSIPVADGLFSTELGGGVSIPSTVGFDKQYFLGVTVGTGSELVPRQALQSTPYALALPGVKNDDTGRVVVYRPFVYTSSTANCSITTKGTSNAIEIRNTAGPLELNGNVSVTGSLTASSATINNGLNVYGQFANNGGFRVYHQSGWYTDILHNMYYDGGWRSLSGGPGTRIAMGGGAGTGAYIDFGLALDPPTLPAGAILAFPTILRLETSGATVTGNCTVSANVRCNTLTLTSSSRFKEDVKPIESPLDTIGKLQGVSYNWDEKHGGKRDMGFIAEDVAKVLPEIVTMEADGKNAVGMDYAHLIALAIEGIKAQQEEIEALKAENAELISAVRALQERSGE